jgi:hypothetical protein
MPFRLMVQDEVLYEGEAPAVPRPGDAIDRDGEARPVEAVTWDFRAGGLVVVTLVVGDRPYTY